MPTQAALEAHIVTFVAPNQAPEWGCDSTWEPNGTPNLENCIAVFGVTYDLGPSSPAYVTDTLSAFNAGALRRFGDKIPYPGILNLDAILPAARSHYTYPGSLVCPPLQRPTRSLRRALPDAFEYTSNDLSCLCHAANHTPFFRSETCRLALSRMYGI